MQCAHCASSERLRMPFAASDDAIERADRRSQLSCASCGGPLVPGDSLRERLTGRLALFARFGLIAGASPLLEMARRRS